MILGSTSTNYSGEVNYASIINAVDEVGKGNDVAPEKDLTTNTIKKEDGSEQDEIFRSMKINDASKTPYSDATQVRNIWFSYPSILSIRKMNIRYDVSNI